MAQKRSAQKLFEQAQTTRSISKAEQLYKDAILKDKSYTQAYITLATLYNSQNNSFREAEILTDALANTTTNKRPLFIRLANAYYLSGQYQLAQETLNKLTNRSQALEHLESCIAFSCDAIQHPSPYIPENLGSKINTLFDDYWPAISIDEQKITTTVLIKKDQGNFFSKNEDLYQSYKTKDGWSQSKAISPIINSSKNEGAQCLSSDGKMMLFTACDRNDGIGSCDIFICYQKNNTWSSPKALPEPINSPYWDGHPSLSADGHFLYFSSDRKNGLGGKDLYRAQIKLNNQGVIVQAIQHLGNKINTAKDEVSPFIHPDSKTLYFSSNGHIGLGKMDIYTTQINADFSAPILNLGYPTNTYQDEIGLVVNASGDKAYFSTQRDDSKGKDIYQFTLSNTYRPEATTYLKASIYNKETNDIISAKLQLHEIKNGKLYYESNDITHLTIPLISNKDYAINVEKAGFLFYSTQFSSENSLGKPLIKDIYLSPIEQNNSIVLNNILFSFNTSQLDTSYNNELNMAIRLIKSNTQLHFCIEGHTDKIGNEKYNQQLSEDRAHAVFQYFITKGINPKQITYKGFGSQRPISDFAYENRRTELRIISPLKQKQ